MADLAKIEQHLTTRSYVDGYAPSSADVKLYDSLNGVAPDAKQYPHAARWYRHILSYASEHSTLPAGTNFFSALSAPAASADKAAPAAEEEDEDIDLFGSDEEDEEEAERIKKERVEKYNEMKEAKKQEKLAAGKTLEVAKSVVTLQVKPWDDETDMEALEAAVRAIEKDGLLWGKSKLVPVGYGIRMLQINLVMEDKISLDELQEEIQEIEDYVQSTDVAAMQKL
ncbi:putative elongation factor 1-beta (ef-1-beta) [Dioszegia hungarica]|uniref:Elongation factor 1-beta (Ef-1-beta) n=1 Tax=Dioszegia hungarica TaxID=4972 RepID=A0AA38LU73_9TREE|nr:putative elongation factor 1-beta (ef-1-beta) [Dioszegia hungarica]KAI9635293.1 putative elongation factor 1-beta (ef-1-beta) [Dioszegia hungarica]